MKIAMRNDYQKLLDYSFWLLGRKAYTEAELRKRLLRRAAKLKLPDAETCTKKVVARLKELKYLDDSKILENYFEYRLKSRPQGKFLYLHQMRRRGIPFDAAKLEWERRKIDEETLAREVLEKKRSAWAGLPAVLQKKKAAQFLASRGFAAETVWSIIGSHGTL